MAISSFMRLCITLAASFLSVLLVTDYCCAQTVPSLDLRNVADRPMNGVLAAPTLFRWGGQPDDEGGPPGVDEPLASDRPDFTEASTTVGRRRLQIETGYTYSRNSDGGDVTRSHSFPETLFRWGVLADWFELRAAFNYGHERVDVAGGPFAATSGAEDLYLGAKLGLTSQHGIFPEMALVPQMTVPTGHSQFTADKTLPGVNWLYGWDVTETISTAGSTQVNMGIDDFDGSDYAEFAQSWTIGYTFTDRLGGYTEWFCILPSGAAAVKPEYYFDGGLTYRVSNNLQLDVRGGVGLSDASADYFVGSGAVVRF